MAFIRYQSRTANALGRDGKYSAEEHVIWRAGNDRYNAAYPNPGALQPGIYDHQINPGAASWFKDSAWHLLERVEPYLRLLDAHQMPWRKLEGGDPGTVNYQGEVQVIVVPRG